MDADATWRAYLIAAMGGTALWAAPALLGGRAEPWDSGLYWTIGYPLALIGSLALGYAFPGRPWRWAVHSQLLVLMVSGSGFCPWGLSCLACCACRPSFLPGPARSCVFASARP